MKKSYVLLFILLLVLTGCDYLPFGYTPIKEIKKNPGRFVDEPVKVRGEVTEITKVPLIESMSYTLRDDSGEILVVTENDLPALNKTVAVKAKVETTAIINKHSFGLRLIEIDKLPTYGLGD